MKCILWNVENLKLWFCLLFKLFSIIFRVRIEFVSVVIDTIRMPYVYKSVTSLLRKIASYVSRCLSSVHTTHVHGPWTRSPKWRRYSWAVDTAREHGCSNYTRVHGPWTRVSFLTPVFTGYVHKMTPVFNSWAVDTARKHGPWTQIVCTSVYQALILLCWLLIYLLQQSCSLAYHQCLLLRLLFWPNVFVYT